MRLLTIPLSHYCERARWALEHCGLSFREERHLQVFHIRAVRRVGGRRTTPVLCVEGHPTLSDSADILAFADEHGTRKIYPVTQGLRAEVQKFEVELAGRFGVETRRSAYFNFLGSFIDGTGGRRDKQRVLKYNNQGAPRSQALALKLGYPIAMRFLIKALKIDAKRVERGRDAIAATFSDVAARLSDGRRYLFGGEFGAADMTFAALAAPILAPPEYGVELPTLEEISAKSRREVERYRAHSAGQFALRIYAENRYPRN